MADQITLDVIDRPSGGTFRTLRTLGRHNGDLEGLRGVVRLRTNSFVDRWANNQTPRRIAALTVWEPGADVEAGWEGLLAETCAGSVEHWHVRGELARASFTAPWRGWTPKTEGAQPLAEDEPALILISGNLRPGGVPGFVRDSFGAVAHAFEHPGYLGGLALMSSPLNTTSCSAWRTCSDARGYAYRTGRHSDAMKRDRADERHVTECFLRIRPTASSGTLEGKPVFTL